MSGVLRVTGRLARDIPWALVTVVLAFGYVIGATAGLIMVAGSNFRTSVRLGWTDARKRGDDGTS
jgi:hypothetical protein